MSRTSASPSSGPDGTWRDRIVGTANGGAIRAGRRLPAPYRWLEAEPGPRMIAEALKQYGTLEAPSDADNPKIIGWQTELAAAGLGRVYASVYRHEAIPWCGLFMAVVAHRANIERRPKRNPPRLYLSALELTTLDDARLRNQARACAGATGSSL